MNVKKCCESFDSKPKPKLRLNIDMYLATIIAMYFYLSLERYGRYTTHVPYSVLVCRYVSYGHKIITGVTSRSNTINTCTAFLHEGL